MFDKLLDLVLQFLQFFQFCHVVKAYQDGVVMRFGRYNRPANPGLVWVWPFFIEDVFTTSVVDEPMEVGPLSLVTKDGKPVVVSALFVVPVTDAKKFLLELEGANGGVLILLRATLADVVRSHTYGELTTSETEKGKWGVDTKLEVRARKQIEQYGASVSLAQIVEVTPARSIRLWGNHA